MGVKKSRVTEAAMKRLRENETEFRELWAGEMGAADIAHKFGMHSDNLRKFAADLGLQNPSDRRKRILRNRSKAIKYTPEFRRMWDSEGLSVPEIGRILGLSGRTVVKYAKLFGLPPRKKHPHGRKPKECEAKSRKKPKKQVFVPEFYTEKVHGKYAKWEQAKGLEMWLSVCPNGEKAKYAGQRPQN